MSSATISHESKISGTEGNGTFDWPLANEAEVFARRQIDTFLRSNAFARGLSDRMRDETGTDFFEWVDHLVISPGEEKALSNAGFVHDPQAETPNGEMVYEHPQATLPRMIVRKGQKRSPSLVALKPEFIAEFAASHNLTVEPEGEPFSRYRRVLIAEENGTQLEAVERRGYRGFVPTPLKAGELAAIIKAKELWQTRPRRFSSDAQGIEAANRILARSMELVGRDLSCQFFFEAERHYWQGRNRAARIQKQRQDQLGLGWGNHDHHTFRCSREHFVDLIAFLEKLGFQKRERYYAGAEAGWGAQIAEQPVTGIVVFADVDLMPGETQVDFSSQKLPPAPRLGTVGLWVGLHGESFLQAGMHHLEGQFSFEKLTASLAALGTIALGALARAFLASGRPAEAEAALRRARKAGFIGDESLTAEITRALRATH